MNDIQAFLATLTLKQVLLAGGAALLVYQFLLKEKIEAAGGFNNWLASLIGGNRQAPQPYQPQVVPPTVSPTQVYRPEPSKVSLTQLTSSYEQLRDQMVNAGVPTDGIDAVFPSLNIKVKK